MSKVSSGSLRLSGNAFQTDGLATENARQPNVFRRHRGTMSHIACVFVTFFDQVSNISLGLDCIRRRGWQDEVHIVDGDSDLLSGARSLRLH